jgi:hypothetical protein
LPQLGAQLVTLGAGVRADEGMHGAHFTDDALDDQVRFDAYEDRSEAGARGGAPK